MAGTTITKGGGGRGQRVLFVLLLFGIVGMHTLGHPTGHASASVHVQRTVHGTVPGSASDAMDSDVGEGVGVYGSVPPQHVSGRVPGHPAAVAATGYPETSASAPMPGDGGMDPLSVCLAVLGSVTLLLLTAALLRPLPTGPLPPARRGAAWARRPRPPPPRTLLARLSVLRI
ncbi:hypothetical protein GTW43_32395 [Streptomyces sp. SID5785]|uniref:hypothetical protein n=1 Tax=Streptomyces sp. SID5785 TaxID=2690309 RepID=UPI0013615089|nr:hypothetical protein [Streptomyces sp. SID5785]MZD09748.1 hypothetical protein [Streptomyces sp. SID5785]